MNTVPSRNPLGARFCVIVNIIRQALEIVWAALFRGIEIRRSDALMMGRRMMFGEVIGYILHDNGLVDEIFVFVVLDREPNKIGYQRLGSDMSCHPAIPKPR